MFTALLYHKNEDIYTRTDHHWSQLGAYYASQEFARLADVPFTDLSEYEKDRQIEIYDKYITDIDEFDTGIFHTVGETNASTATDLATDYKTKNSNNGYCFLGRLTSKAATISVKCTAWFEGTDDNVVNEALNQVVTTTQRFYVRKLAKIK